MQEGDSSDHPPILCFDGDNAGRRAAIRAVERILPILNPGRSVAVAFLPDGDDPDSLVRRGGAGEVKRVLDGAFPLIEAVWDFASGGRQLATPEQRAGFWADLEAQIRKIADRDVQSLYRVELRRRFDAQFLRRSTQDRRTGDRRGGPKPFAPQGPRPTAVRKSAVLHARIMLAMMINHPFLFDTLSETFAEIDLPVAWEPLRRTVFDLLTGQALDAQALCVHLEMSGYRPQLEDKLGPTTTDHAKFVRPDTPEDEVLAGWRDVWNMAHRRGLELELAAARADPNRGEDQALERISKLGERRIDLFDTADSSDTGASGSDDHEGIVARAIADALKSPRRESGLGDSTGNETIQ
jgi:DNA primase